MADLKISQLSAATALAGTEVVPVVQGGTTKKATIDQILAPASGKGIDFSAAGGDTLKMYDEGNWTPTDNSGAGLTLTVNNATYTRIGRQVFANFAITYPGTVDPSTARIGGLPFASSSTGFSHPMVVSTCDGGTCKSGLVDTSATTFLLLDTNANVLTVAQMSGKFLRGTAIYEV